LCPCECRNIDVLGLRLWQELELLLCGLPVIDITEWKANCEYKAGYDADSDVVCWLWELLEAWDQVRPLASRRSWF
jgi:hypothetical protein